MIHPAQTDGKDEQRLLGSFVEGRFKVTSSLIALLGVALLTTIFAAGSDDTREILTFMVLTGALAGGAISAYYLWAGLKMSIRQRTALRQEERVKMSLGYLSRWNDPNLADTRRGFRAVVAELRTSPETRGAELVEQNEDKRAIVLDTLNFFEEMGFAAKSGAADLKTLEELFRETSLLFFSAARPWIEFKRKEFNSPRILANLEWLCDQWKVT